MFSQFFGQYLLDNQKITAEQFSSCGSPALINALHTTIASAIVTASNTHERKYLQ